MRHGVHQRHRLHLVPVEERWGAAGGGAVVDATAQH
jgi:hypothetical protein